MRTFLSLEPHKRRLRALLLVLRRKRGVQLPHDVQRRIFHMTHPPVGNMQAQVDWNPPVNRRTVGAD